MSNIILANDKEKFQQMFTKEAIGPLVKGMLVAIDASFKAQKMRNPTEDEVRRRFNILMKWARTLRGDLKWGVQRICDEMPNILLAELLGNDYKPDEGRQCWIPRDGV